MIFETPSRRRRRPLCEVSRLEIIEKNQRGGLLDVELVRVGILIDAVDIRFHRDPAVVGDGDAVMHVVLTATGPFDRRHTDVGHLLERGRVEIVSPEDVEIGAEDPSDTGKGLDHSVDDNVVGVDLTARSPQLQSQVYKVLLSDEALGLERAPAVIRFE